MKLQATANSIEASMNFHGFIAIAEALPESLRGLENTGSLLGKVGDFQANLDLKASLPENPQTEIERNAGRQSIKLPTSLRR